MKLFNSENNTIDFNQISAGNIKKAKDNIIKESEKKVAEIVGQKPEDRNFGNTLSIYDDLNNELDKIHSIIFLMAYVHPEEEIRNASLKAIKDLSKYGNQLNLNIDLYKAIKDYSIKEDKEKLSGAEKKLLKDTIRDLELNGLGLPKKQRDLIQNLQNQISELGIAFESNISSHKDIMVLEEEEMKGLPEDYKEARKRKDGKYEIDMTYPSYFPFMKYAKSDKARKELSKKFKNIAADKNLDVLVKLLKKRKELAKILGYDSFARYRLVTRMAKKPETVWEFEESLWEKVQQKANKDYKQLLDKKSEHEAQTVSKINSWESAYYNTLLLKEDYHVDQEKIKEYFELNKVLKGLFTITQNLYGISIREVNNPSIWHKEVRLFEVKEKDKTIGWFYLDLFPRDNKFNHAACFSMVPGKKTPRGYQKPMAALVTNFPKATQTKPSLLPHSDVVTLFHEFGHLMHDLLTEAPFSIQSGTNTSRDFVEVPSQIFEHWAWEYDSVKLFAKHYLTNEVLPEDLHQKMVQARNVGSGLFTQQQIFYGILDMTYHDQYDPENSAESTTDIVRKLQNQLTQFEYMEDTHFQAGFGHLFGYAAGYYGYLWAKVYAEDMFSVFQENGVLNRENGLKFRKKVLSKGSSKEEIKIVRDFLGRDAQYLAFLKSIGIENQ